MFLVEGARFHVHSAALEHRDDRLVVVDDRWNHCHGLVVASCNGKELLIHLLFDDVLLIIDSRVTFDDAVNVHLLQLLDVWALLDNKHFWSAGLRRII